MSSVIQVSAINYPESDGRPMGETDEHRDAMVRHIELLKYRFRDQQVYVSGDLLVYHEQGNPKKFVVPDAFVVKGIDPKKRRVYKLWIEGKAPDVVLETTSRKTKKKDTDVKPMLYARLGVKELFLFDPTQDYLDPPLQGHRLCDGSYRPIEPDADGALRSTELVLNLKVESGQLQFYDVTTGERLLTAEERSARDAELRNAEAVARKAAEARAADEAEARGAAEVELKRLQKEIQDRDARW